MRLRLTLPPRHRNVLQFLVNFHTMLLHPLFYRVILTTASALILALSGIHPAFRPTIRRPRVAIRP